MNKQVYLANPNLKAAGVQIPFTEWEVEEYVRCSQDLTYFVKKYCKIVNVDKGLINFEMFDYQEEMINLFKENRKVIVKLPRQMGKALDIQTPIFTPKGFKLLSEISVGDRIFGPDGKETSVTFITDVMHNRPCFRVQFSNGDVINADTEHLWTVNSSNWGNQEKTLTTEELIPYLSHTSKPYINFTNPIELEEQKLPIDPYILGVWLGDGNSRDARITCHINDLEEYRHWIPISHTYIDKRNSNVVSAQIEGLHTALRTNKLLQNKHIPAIYLKASISQRVSLLQGLMDTDGSVTNRNGSCQWYQKNEALVDQVRFLLASLGIKSTKNSKNVNGQLYFAVTFTPSIKVFRLKRKLLKQGLASHPKNSRLYITSIEPIDSVPVRCLQVDNESHLFLAGNTLIPTHNTTTTAAFFLWYILFHDNKVTAILANKAVLAREILARIKLMYEHLPFFIQQGITEWNKGSITLENGSRVLAAATSSSGIRGYSLSLVFLDEFAHVHNNIAEEFFTSIFPTISSGKETKILISSTPNGMNHFYKFWMEAEAKTNGFLPVFYEWNRMPGRDQEWVREQETALGPQKFLQEVLCQFIGSSATLISGAKLAAMAIVAPLQKEYGFDIFEHPKDNHTYVLSCDPSRGLGKDSSAFTIIDITQLPYRVVAKYKSNTISPIILPSLIFNAATRYNKAYVLVEINDNGQQVVDMLHWDLEYENIFKFETAMKGQGAQASTGHKPRTMLGVKTTEPIKRIGCTNLKTLIEQDKLIVTDYDIIHEFSTFTQQLQTWKAEEGFHDDLVMSLVLFSWLTTQKYFRESVQESIRKAIESHQASLLEGEVTPFGYMDDGQGDRILVEDGDVWTSAQQRMYGESDYGEVDSYTYGR